MALILKTYLDWTVGEEAVRDLVSQLYLCRQEAPPVITNEESLTSWLAKFHGLSAQLTDWIIGVQADLVALDDESPSP